MERYKKVAKLIWMVSLTAYAITEITHLIVISIASIIVVLYINYKQLAKEERVDILEEVEKR